MEEKYIGLFEERKVALIGNKRICRHFYLQFRAVLDLQYYLSTAVDIQDRDADISFGDVPELVCMFLKSSLVFEQNLLLILCVEHPFRHEYDRLLFQYGLEWGKDYIDALYVIQYYRYKYNISLKKKNLWIFGAGENGQYFCREYLQKAYSVAGFLSNYKNEKECLGLPVIQPSELLEQKNYYIVICGPDALLAEELCELGFSGSKDFCFMETLPKALFLAVGTCQIINSTKFLFQNNDFNLQYYGCSYLDNRYDPCSMADNKRLEEYGRFCDVILYNIANAGTTDFRNYESLIRNYYKNARHLFMPFYYFKGQMMQATDGVNPYALRSYEGEQFWFRGDQEVNHMVEKGYSIEKIVEEILRADYWPRQKILNHFKLELKKIEVLDRFSSFPIKGFIEKNYQKMSVFADGTHFNYPLYLYVANKIAETLQVKQVVEQNAENEIDFPLSVMPVYPCVQKALNMKQQNKYPFLNKKKKAVEYLDIIEYISRYAKYVINVREMYREIGTDWR